MPIEKISIARDPKWYLAWPDVVLTDSGRLVCVFSECTHHGNRSHTRILLSDSTDRGATWTPRRPLTEATDNLGYYYNCARISKLSDGRLCVAVDRIPIEGETRHTNESVVYLYFSADDGQSWSAPVETPVRGIVPDKLLELANGRWLLAAHAQGEDGFLVQYLRYSDDRGATWSDRVTVARQNGLNLCEVSLIPVGGSDIVALMRENSFKGYDCKKTISHDNGETWGPVIDFPLPGCHRPVAGHLADGRALVTYRFLQGGVSSFGSWTQNFFAALTDDDSLLSDVRERSWTRIMPVDFDRSPHSDLGYSGWAQFPDGEIYVVNYIVDDAIDKGQIRGYRFRPEDFLLPG